MTTNAKWVIGILVLIVIGLGVWWYSSTHDDEYRTPTTGYEQNSPSGDTRVPADNGLDVNAGVSASTSYSY